MKTFKQLYDEALSLTQRKAVGRRMAKIAKKSSTKMRKKMNQMKRKKRMKKNIHY